MSDDEDQSRLQEYGVDIEPAPVDDAPATCERCGEELEDEGRGVRHLSGEEQVTGVFDNNRSSERDLCENCFNLEKYLNHRYAELSEEIQTRAVVAVFCECQDSDEVDVQAVRRHEPIGGRACSRCGSREVIIEELPVSAPTLEEVNL